MKTTLRLAAAALSFVAAGAAFAESPIAYPQDVAAVSQLSRSEVRAQVLANGPQVVTEGQLQQIDGFAPLRSRAEVRAETLAAIANGEIVATGAEIFAAGSGAVAQSVQLARIGR